MDLRQLKIWKRESKPEAVLRSPSSDSGYSDVPGVASSKPLTRCTIGRLRLQKKSPLLPQPIIASVVNQPPPGKATKSGTEGRGRGTPCNHPDLSPEKVKGIDMEKFVGFVKTGNLASIQSLLAEDRCDVNGKDSVSFEFLYQ